MHYVITGGGGFLGAHLIAAIQRSGDFRKIIVVDPNPKHQDLDSIIFNTEMVSYELGSFRDSSVLEKVLPGAATVFHLCAIGHTGIYGRNKYAEYVYDFNVRGTMELVQKCKEFEVKRFIYSSSVAVNFIGEPFYDLQEDSPLPDPSKYIDSYSYTKAEAEKYVISQSSPSFKTTALRFRAIYGPNDVTVAEKVVRVALSGWFLAKISRDKKEAISNMSAGENCGDAMVLADKALQDDTKNHGQVYFIHDGNTIGQYSVWTPLIEALGKRPPSYFIPYQLVKYSTSAVAWIFFNFLERAPPMTEFELAILVNDNTYSIAKAENELGFVPNKDLFDKTVQYYRNETMQSEAMQSETIQSETIQSETMQSETLQSESTSITKSEAVLLFITVCAFLMLYCSVSTVSFHYSK